MRYFLLKFEIVLDFFYEKRYKVVPLMEIRACFVLFKGVKAMQVKS